MPLRALLVPLLLTVPVVIETLRRRPEGRDQAAPLGQAAPPTAPPAAPAARPTFRAAEVRPLRRNERSPAFDLGASWTGRDLAPDR